MYARLSRSRQSASRPAQQRRRELVDVTSHGSRAGARGGVGGGWGGHPTWRRWRRRDRARCVLILALGARRSCAGRRTLPGVGPLGNLPITET